MDDSLPLVTIIHGGGWESRAGAEQFDEMARDLAGRGLAVYNVEYRRLGTGGGWPTTFHDVALALDHVPAIAETYPQLRIDDELVIGDSAGAQLAVWGGTRHRLTDDEVGSRPAFVPSNIDATSPPARKALTPSATPRSDRHEHDQQIGRHRQTLRPQPEVESVPRNTMRSAPRSPAERLSVG